MQMQSALSKTRQERGFLLSLVFLALSPPLLAQPQRKEASPMTEVLSVAEATKYKETSRYEDVMSFLEKLRSDQFPNADRLRVKRFAKTVEGRSLPLVIAADPMVDGPEAARSSSRVRLLVNANIHAGEVEGKAAVQILLREIAEGKHEDLLENAILLFVPIFNADGNDRILKSNRPSQNGPEGGVGVRPNAKGLDLNRDFIKLESPEVSGLVKVMREWDPHLFMDLHTTNGSYHGYHLTYSPSLSANIAAELDSFGRKEVLAPVRASLAKQGFRIYDYGNFMRNDPERGWVTYDHRPRFGTNYFALRNRISILSESYSYLDFKGRIDVTKAFVLGILHRAVEKRDELRRLCKKLDDALVAAPESQSIGYDTHLRPPFEDEILIGSVTRMKIEGVGTRLLMDKDYEAKKLPVQSGFEAKKKLALPAAWCIGETPPGVLETLRKHGVRHSVLSKASLRKVGRFTVEEMRRARRPFQGHHELRLEGAWISGEHELPKGAVVVPAAQALGRLAAQLLEPQSEGSLFTWNFFHSWFVENGEEGKGPIPIYRLSDVTGLEFEKR